jgi:hypothetical protein
MRKIINTVKEKRWLQFVLYTALIFFLFLAFWNQARFISDEQELFVKGQQMALGQRLYVDIITQHMPILYHVAALFSLVGIQTVAGFRAAFYLLFALLWGLGFVYYGPKLGRKAVGITPLIYFALISGILYATSVISDQIQAIGTAYLLFAMLQFYKTRKVTVIDSLFISAGIFMSFYAAFISAFSIFAAFLFVLAIEIKDAGKEGRTFGKEILYLIKKYYLMVIIIALPSILLFVYYDYQNILKGFFKWGYLFNRQVYPRYNGGYGDNPLSALFGGFSSLISALSIGQLTTTAVINVVFIALAGLFLIEHYRKNKDKLFLLGVVFFVITSASRGAFEFHGLAALSAISALGAFYISGKMPTLIQKARPSALKVGALVLAVGFLGSNYLAILPSALSFTTKEYVKTNTATYALGAITDKNERVGFASMNYDILMGAGVIPASFGCSDFPWYWEWCGTQEMAELEMNKPRAFLYAPANTWGYPFDNYAREITRFVTTHYAHLDTIGYPGVYVLKDYYNEAVMKIQPDKLYFNDTATDLAGPLLPGVKIGQTFVADEETMLDKVDLKVATYGRTNTCTVQLELLDNTTGETAQLMSLSAQNLKNNDYQTLDFADKKLEAGHSYTLLLSSPDATRENTVAIWYGEAKLDGEAYYAVVDGEPRQFGLTMRIFSGEKLLPVIENAIR